MANVTRGLMSRTAESSDRRALVGDPVFGKNGTLYACCRTAHAGLKAVATYKRRAQKRGTIRCEDNRSSSEDGYCLPPDEPCGNDKNLDDFGNEDVDDPLSPHKDDGQIDAMEVATIDRATNGWVAASIGCWREKAHVRAKRIDMHRIVAMVERQ